MRGSVIGPLNNNPNGRFLEGILSDTSPLGVAMEVDPNFAPTADGKHHWRHYQPSADDDPRLMAILVPGFPSSLQGTPPIFPGPQVAGVAGTRCFLYCPLPGDEMNINVEGEVGTGSANAFTVGERLQPVHTSGKFKKEATSSALGPFVVLEHIDEVPDTDTLVWCMFSGY